jgi:hypothetical protein
LWGKRPACPERGDFLSLGTTAGTLPEGKIQGKLAGSKTDGVSPVKWMGNVPCNGHFYPEND